MDCGIEKRAAWLDPALNSRGLKSNQHSCADAFIPSEHEQPNPRINQAIAKAALEIWLIEDNRLDAFVIRKVIDSLGLSLRLEEFEDGQAALDSIQAIEDGRRQNCPHLILLDLNLPKRSGIELLRSVRSSTRCKEIPAIIVTSSNSELDRDAVRELGVDDYFLKPMDLPAYAELAEIIMRVIRSKRPVGQ
jgi:CheY-like chemotaxis protein